MARTVAQTTASTKTAMVTNTNVLLAALTNPVIKGLKISVGDEQRRMGREYRALLTYDTGGAALATPFLIGLYEEKSMAALVTALQTFMSANVAYFFAAPFLYVIDDQVRTPAYGAMLLYNTTGGASANCVPLNP